MNSKKKLIVSMLVVSFVLLSIIATVAIAFALTQQTIKTTLNIGYTVEDIDGTASATFTIGGVTESLVAMKGTQVIGDKLVFKAGDTTDAGNLMFPEDALALSAQNDNVVIQYTYSNTGAKHYIASMDFNANISADNMKVEYSIDGTTYSEDRYAVVVPANTSNRSYWIKISIADKAKSASFTGDFDWLLSGCDPQDKAYLSLPKVEFQGSAGSYSASISSNSQYVGNMVFPKEVNGDPVTVITANPSLTQEQKNQVTSVYIPSSVTRLNSVRGQYPEDYFGAFQDFENLQTITFEQNESAGAISQSVTGLTFIDGQAFLNCKSLKEFIMPNTVTSMDDAWGYQFMNCTNLQNVVFSDNMKDIPCGVFYKCTSLKQFEIPNTVKDIAFDAFAGSGLVSIIIPDNFTAISPSLFKDCNNLKTVTIGKGVKTIYGGAFYNCKNLTSIIIPESVETIEYEAFSGCTSLTSITIPSSVTSIGAYAFYDCTNLKNITTYTTDLDVLSSIKSLCGTNGDFTLKIYGGERLYGYTQDAELVLNYWSGLKVLEIGYNIKSLEYSFCSCPDLEVITLLEGATYIGQLSFTNCTALREVNLPSTMNCIGPDSLVTNSNLLEINFADPTGWKLWSGNSVEEYIDSSILANPTTAADYIKTHNLGSHWLGK